MSFEAITTISDAENRARQIKADAQAAAAAAVEAAQAEGKAAIEAAVGKAQQELQTLRAKSDEKAKADAETLAAQVFLFGFDETVDTVQCQTAVVTDDTSACIVVGKSGEEAQ